MNTQTLLIQLEAWVAEEIAAQERMRKVLEEQREAVRSGKTPELVASGEAVEAELKRGPARELKRQRLASGLAQGFGVTAGALTISSVIERAGVQGLSVGKLPLLRDELRTVTAEVLKLGRSIKSLARYHQGLLADVMGVIADSGVPCEPGQAVDRGVVTLEATLVDAEA